MDSNNGIQEVGKFAATYDTNFPRILYELNSTLILTTYQAGRTIFLSSDTGERILQIPAGFKKPMGVSILDKKLAIATLDEIHVFSGSEKLAEYYPDNPNTYDIMYVPRATYYNGETDLHDLGFGKGGLWAVNTKFSCLATFDVNYSFNPRWKPPFISSLAPQDRCHLNGMAMKDQVPAFVTALGTTDTKQGWREDIISGGVLMSVPDGEVIVQNLPMPHSPRLYNDQLYVLLSATGDLVRVDIETKSHEKIVNFPGLIRGMSILGDYAFIGVSKVRESSKTFHKLPVSTMSKKAGIIVVDLKQRSIVSRFMYDSTVDEIYDVQLLQGYRKPGLITTRDERHKTAISTKSGAFWINKEKKENEQTG